MKKMLHRPFNWFKSIFDDQERAQNPGTIAALDGVRACAVLFVIIFHINWIDKNYGLWHQDPLISSITIAGSTAVTLFFVLSGFLLFLPYVKALLSGGNWPLARSFYVKRALRIMPGYYLSLAILILLTSHQYLHLPALSSLKDQLVSLVDPAKAYRTVNITNLGLFLTFLMDSSKQTFRQINGPYWTLAIEWQFYMVLPLLALGLLLLVRRVRPAWRARTVLGCLCALTVLGLLIHLWGDYYEGHHAETILVPRSVLNLILFFTYGQMGKFIEDFGIGMLCAFIYAYAQSLPPEHRFVQTVKRMSLWLWGAGLLILLYCAMWHFQIISTIPAWFLLSHSEAFFNRYSEIVLSIGYGTCLLAIVFGSRELQSMFSWAPLRWIGQMSYSLYLWHLPLLALLVTRIIPALPATTNYYPIYALYWAWAIFVIFPFSFLYYVLVERPGVKLGNRWRKVLEARYYARKASQTEAEVSAANTPKVAVSLGAGGK